MFLQRRKDAQEKELGAHRKRKIELSDCSSPRIIPHCVDTFTRPIFPIEDEGEGDIRERVIFLKNNPPYLGKKAKDKGCSPKNLVPCPTILVTGSLSLSLSVLW